MKYIKFKILPSLLIFAIINISCERDDICPESTPTTPRLIMDAFDISNQENSRNIFKLRIQGVGNTEVLTSVIEGNEITYDGSETDPSTIYLPLKTNDTITHYQLHRDYTYDDNETPNDTSDDTIGGNEDIITINYSTEEVYVSRACGFKAIFTNVRITIVPDSDNWIELIQPVNDNQSIEDETAAHFNLFH